MKAAVAAATLALIAAPAAAHIGDHSHGAAASAWHFVTEPAHLLPVLALAAVVVGALAWRGKRRAEVRRRKGES